MKRAQGSANVFHAQRVCVQSHHQVLKGAPTDPYGHMSQASRSHPSFRLAMLIGKGRYLAGQELDMLQKPIWASCVVQRGYDFTTDPQVQSMGLSFSGEVRGAWFKADSTILQWTEDKSCSSHSTGGGGREKDCTYDYNLEWVSSPQSSSNFYCYPVGDPAARGVARRFRTLEPFQLRFNRP